MNLSDSNSSNESLLVFKTKDHLILTDSNIGTDDYILEGSKPLSDINLGVEVLCIRVTRTLNLTDSNKGIDGLGIVAGSWDNPDNRQPTEPLTHESFGLGTLNQVYVVILSDQNVGNEVLTVLLNGSPIPSGPSCHS